ncbi:hypothetical protein CCY99_05050 [Helicobacter sp. 16-1353]|uniref:DNA methyltransferase n=1 Tax=Helicobacter sp. 16-1353 TaxID=2004996 RepID=UPI000DCCADC0|nr:DNA methyltransferase [Helicobacter sp. 16-1353]RAX54051.1 hypothetical protein CCY99_05050 [Helicobacter sp. 16-1353]
MPLLQHCDFTAKDSKNPKPLELALSLKITSQTILGSNQKITLTRFPDYVLYVDSKPHCVLDAKAPNININLGSKAERQAFYYAINPDIKSPYYALCNGYYFMLFETLGQNLLLEINLRDEFQAKFPLLKQYLTTPLQSLKQLTPNLKSPKKDDEWYLSRPLPKTIDNPKKQAKARYFGCTAYFTRQSWDIVALNIKNFTDEGDVVFDPFGGSGVTAIEAMMNNRLGIHTDLNPLSIFLTKALSAKVNLGEFYDLSEEIISELETLKPKDKNQAKEILKNATYYPNAIDKEFGETASIKKQEDLLWIPKDEILPKGSDVDSLLKLFSPMQLAELAILRKIIFKKTIPSGNKESRIHKRNLRYSLLLAFYNTVTLINLTYHNTPKGGPASAISRYYRYRIAPKPDFLNIDDVFRGKIKRVIKGKEELENYPIFYKLYSHSMQDIIKDFQGSTLKNRESNKSNSSIENTEKIFQADATNLKEIESKSIDYIYTDPPYGAKIPYLDLSTMWNAWLDFEVDKNLREKECIEKGSLEKSRAQYHELMIKSLQEMYRVLKYNRWLSFVFQHQDPQLWQILVEEAEKIGFEYIGSVRQNNGQTTFKKRQNPFTVLSGQLIMHFKKIDKPKARTQEQFGDILGLVMNNIEAIIAKDNGASLEEIYGELTIKGLELGFLHELGKMFENLTPIINQHFDYDETSKKYHIKKGEKFKNHTIDIRDRTKYFIISFLRSCERQRKKVSFDDICLEVIPLLKNGIIPSKDLIRDTLEEIASIDSGFYRLKGVERSLFD